MIKDNRLFAANSPIGRFGYFLNLVILAAIVYFSEEGINHYVIPNANPAYEIPAKWILYFIYFIAAITFAALIHRRTYDICGTKDAGGYKWISRMTGVTAVLYLLAAFDSAARADFPAGFYAVLIGWTALYLCIALLLGLFPGRFVNTGE